MAINLQGKNLNAFPPFGPSENQILLNQNQITTIPPIIGTAVNLIHLYLSNNKIKEIPIQVGSLKRLSVLMLDNNEITQLPPQIGDLISLSQLRLQGNKIRELPIQISSLKNLAILMLDNNEITQLPPQIGDLISLTQLRLQNNKLTELPKEIGNLVNLTHLFLDNNQISFFPEEIKNLKKLVHLSISGNQIQLPETYAPTKVQETIAFILEQQNELTSKDSLVTRKAYYFTNASKETVVEKYKSVINNFAEDKSIDFVQIDSVKSIQKDTNVVFIIAPIDSHSNEKLIFDIAKNCKKLGIRFFILTQERFIETDFDSANLSKWGVFDKTLSQLRSQFPDECKSYSSYEEFDSLVYEALKQHKPNIRLSKLVLENIGHFSNFEMSFDNDLTCLIGENGTGKSTILRAIALAIIGADHKRLEEKAKRGFLKIQGFSEDNIVYADGLIRLEYSIDGDNFYNELKFIANDNGNDITIIPSGDSQIVYSKYNLKSLIVGFPQGRGNDISTNSDFIQNRITQPHINDLLPLINNSDDFRLRSFSGWIANLYFDSIKSKEKNVGVTKEVLLINQAFDIISKITKKEMAFKTVTKIDPPDVWVTTYDSPNGIPLNLVSQGFKIVIGWIGFLLQRFVNTFPLSDPISAFKENAIVILDEVDISMHPVWQLSFIEILRETFSNTQFIFTTHDPLVIGSLLKEQVRVFIEKKGLIEVVQPEVDPKGLGVAGILTSELFGLHSTLDEKTLSVLERRNELIAKQDKQTLSTEESIELNQIFQNLNSLGINTTDRDPLYQKFIVAYSEREEFKKDQYSPEELKEQNKIAGKILEEILKEQEKDK